VPIALNKRLGVSAEVLVAEMQLKYDNGFTQNDLSKYYNCHSTTIEGFFAKYKSKARLPGTKFVVPSPMWSEIEQEVLDGILLADGHLSRQVNGARLTYGCKFRETLSDIEKSLPTFTFSPHWQSSKTNCWHFKSRTNTNLLSEQEKWYKDRIKFVPRDVKITPLSCYWWMLGDGCVDDYRVLLATDCFTKSDNEFLVSKLIENNFKKARLDNQNHIRLGGCDGQEFLNWIRESVPIASQYLYKWDHKKKKHKKFSEVKL
jgi:hypothetical protein